ncbi:MAG: 4-hydroxy-tetrahydrodipicolinate reductase [Microbacteriaceae bacterium]
MTTKVAIAGATGRLGRDIVQLVESEDDFQLVAGLDSHSDLSDLLGADLIVDVTLPEVSPTIVEYAVANGIHILVGTSGWTAERIAQLRRRMGETPQTGVVIIPNFSIGAALAIAFASVAARFYESIEIVEAHRAHKIDSPSGTAVRTAELIAAARAGLGPVAAPHTDQRARGQNVASIPVHSLRLSGVVARQQVVFGGAGEVLTIDHETLEPSAYRAGILLGLRGAPEARGVMVGLENLIDLGISHPRA